jgi:hydroxymethylbilane synthase
MTSTSPSQSVWAEIAAAAAARFTREAPLGLGGRGSAMSLAQLEDVAARIGQFVPGIGVRIVPIKVGADTAVDRPPVEGKKIYTDNIDCALLAGDIHAAVHCEKDLDAEPEAESGIVTAARLARGSVLDALISSERRRLDELPSGARIGTCAPRRTAQLRRLRPDLVVVPVKGNVDSRIARLTDPSGGLDGLVVSYEGLLRLGLPTAQSQTFTLEQIAPAAGAAVVTVQSRRDDALVTALLAALRDPETDAAASAERAMLAGLGGNCSSAISGHATVARAGGDLTLTGKVFSPDGAEAVEYVASGLDPWALGAEVARELTARGADRLLAAAHTETPQ